MYTIPVSSVVGLLLALGGICLMGGLMNKQRFGFIVFTVLSFSAAARSDRVAVCTPQPSIGVSSFKELPLDVREFLLRAAPGSNGIADAGEKFNASCVVLDATVPRQRFISALAGDDCIRVTVERGGRGHSVSTLTFQRSNDNWIHIASKNGYGEPK
jgi:hypothetical protein